QSAPPDAVWRASPAPTCLCRPCPARSPAAALLSPCQLHPFMIAGFLVDDESFPDDVQGLLRGWIEQDVQLYVFMSCADWFEYRSCCSAPRQIWRICIGLSAGFWSVV